ncbi:glycosyltransferase family 4 protein [Candidatus Saccharibacteria bacterium]|nr:glycosyltransferase family 4 protein [Candidatus Saccharibacteria bacterium]
MYHIAIDARIISSSTGRYVERLLHYLEQLDRTNRYTILVRAKDKQFYRPTNPNFHIVVADYADYSFAEQLGFKKQLDELGADLVHFCMPQQPILYRGLHVTTIHDLTLLKTYNSDKNWLAFHLKQLVGRGVFRWVSHSSQAIIVPSKYTEQDLLSFTKAARGKTYLTYEAADALALNELKPYPEPLGDFILYVGQQSDYKNIRRLGDAHQQLLTHRPELKLVLVGRKNAATQRNEAYFQKQGYRNIIFTDFVEDAVRDWLYANCRAYVFPSLMEGFGLPGLEAMQYGAPLVSSNATCLPEVYSDAAHYFDPYDTNDIARAITDVLDDDMLCDTLVQNSQRVLARYSWEKTARETLAVYRAVLRTAKLKERHTSP